jgi:catechol 2,3-dioxygenase-like lactoylglutathione lyase family enzyme
MITTVQFTGVWISDSERAYDFYVNKLGFTVAQDRKFGGGNRFLMVVPPGGGTGMTVCTPMPGMTDVKVGGMTTIAFLCDDIQATYEDLKAKGVEFRQPPTQAFWGGMEATFLDPDGNAFMLHQLEA